MSGHHPRFEDIIPVYRNNIHSGMSGRPEVPTKEGLSVTSMKSIEIPDHAPGLYINQSGMTSLLEDKDKIPDTDEPALKPVPNIRASFEGVYDNSTYFRYQSLQRDII